MAQDKDILIDLPLRFDIEKAYLSKAKHNLLKNNKKYYCGRCGKLYKDEAKSNLPRECTCNIKYYIGAYQAGTKTDFDHNSVYISTLESVNGKQLIRYFLVGCSEEIGKEHTPYECHEVSRFLINEKGVVTFAKIHTYSVYYSIKFAYGTPLKIAKYNSSYDLCIKPCRVQKAKFLKYLDFSNYLEIVKHANEYDRYRSLSLLDYIKLYISEPTFVETLNKLERFDLIAGYRADNTLKNELMLLARKNLTFNVDFTLWKDYIHAIKEIGWDIKNPKIVRPNDDDFQLKNIQAENKAARLRTKKELESNIEKYNSSYIERTKEIVGIDFGNEKFSIKILKDIEEFFDEGIELHHCVYRMGYYKMKNSYVFSVRVNDKRTETLELSKNGDKLVIHQLYGFGDKETEYHKDILNLVNKNMQMFQQAICC